MRPLRLYDVESGRTIEVFLHRNSPNSGRLLSAKIQSEKFEGEIIFYGEPSSPYRDWQTQSRTMGGFPTSTDFAEMYGFGKDSQARPAGTAMLVGTEGTTIEVVLYRISTDLQYGDGVAKDNKGRRYRVFLSVEG